MSVSVPESKVKVWRPQGFEGVEVELLENLKSQSAPKQLLLGHEITCWLGGGASFEYRKMRHAYYDVKNMFLAQTAGETYSLEAPAYVTNSVWTIRLLPKAMDDLQTLFGVSRSPHFNKMTAAQNSNRPLARLTTETVQAFDSSTSHLERESKLLSLTYAVLKHCSDTPPSDLKLGKEHKAVRLVKEVAQAHYAQELKLDDLGKLANLSKFYLMRVFQRDVGISPHKYQTGLRINLAKERLTKGAQIVDVALDLGFSDQAHFTRTFKMYTQTTPGRFQKLSLAS